MNIKSGNKNSNILNILMLILMMLTLTSCSNTVTLKLDAGQGIFANNESIKIIDTESGTTIRKSELIIPDRGNDFEFGGWLRADGDLVDTDYKIKSKETLNAKWLEKRIEIDTIIEKIAFVVEKIDDPSILKGEEVVQFKGVEGERTIVKELLYVDNVLKNTSKVEDKITTAVQNEIILIGTQEPKQEILSLAAPLPVKPVEPNKPAAPIPSKPVPPKPATIPTKPAPTPAEPAKPVPAPVKTAEPVKPAPEPAKPAPPAGNYTPTHGVPVIPNSFNDDFPNCTEVRKVYPGGIPKGHPAYKPKHDRDKDGWGCEVKGK